MKKLLFISRYGLEFTLCSFAGWLVIAGGLLCIAVILTNAIILLVTRFL